MLNNFWTELLAVHEPRLLLRDDSHSLVMTPPVSFEAPGTCLATLLGQQLEELISSVEHGATSDWPETLFRLYLNVGVPQTDKELAQPTTVAKMVGVMLVGWPKVGLRAWVESQRPYLVSELYHQLYSHFPKATPKEPVRA